eukprot:CAMPEP_0185280714 /NCGR_PEP_ID=MMETSP1359-20130426/66306_1 /TAXON_ID=552665 /ORGANISM="Bigelowiella longifila, Strain CCMP242" /LENGTH=145 /DNA_ID=CAMNT_0027876047 /DNA_START=868 /DNA_END=1305 /DNA_ORIENTATION=-
MTVLSASDKSPTSPSFSSEELLTQFLKMQRKLADMEAEREKERQEREKERAKIQALEEKLQQLSLAGDVEHQGGESGFDQVQIQVQSGVSSSRRKGTGQGTSEIATMLRSLAEVREVVAGHEEKIEHLEKDMDGVIMKAAYKKKK